MEEKKCFNLVIAFAAVFLFASCEKNISEPEYFQYMYQRFGGPVVVNDTINEWLLITKDSMYYMAVYLDTEKYEVWEPATIYSATVVISTEQWDFLSRTFDLKTFKKIGRCKPDSFVAGEFIEEFTFLGNGKHYIACHKKTDENFQQMKDFFDFILEQMAELSVAAGFRE